MTSGRLKKTGEIRTQRMSTLGTAILERKKYKCNSQVTNLHDNTQKEMRIRLTLSTSLLIADKSQVTRVRLSVGLEISSRGIGAGTAVEVTAESFEFPFLCRLVPGLDRQSGVGRVARHVALGSGKNVHLDLVLGNSVFDVPVAFQGRKRKSNSSGRSHEVK